MLLFWLVMVVVGAVGLKNRVVVVGALLLFWRRKVANLRRMGTSWRESYVYKGI